MEEYKAIPFYENYEISKSGLIRSLDRIITHKNGKKTPRKGKNITCKKNLKEKSIIKYIFIKMVL